MLSAQCLPLRASWVCPFIFLSSHSITFHYVIWQLIQPNVSFAEYDLQQKPNVIFVRFCWYYMFSSCLVAANTIYSMVDHEHWTNQGHGSQISISKDRLIDDASQLCRILKYEYIFAPVSVLLCCILKYEYIFAPVSVLLNSVVFSNMKTSLLHWVYFLTPL